MIVNLQRLLEEYSNPALKIKTETRLISATGSFKEFLLIAYKEYQDIPNEYKETATISYDYDGDIEITYTRKETQEELNKRLKDFEATKELNRLTELQQLKELKEKYEAK